MITTKPTKTEARWTNSMFGGMPTVTINKVTKGNYIRNIGQILESGAEPASYLFLSLLGGFLFLSCTGISPWISVLGAVAITFCSYNFQIIQAGHVTKMIAIAYVPWVLASLAYAYRKHALTGALFCTYRGVARGGQPSANYVLPGIHPAFCNGRASCRSGNTAPFPNVHKNHPFDYSRRPVGSCHLCKPSAADIRIYRPIHARRIGTGNCG